MKPLFVTLLLALCLPATAEFPNLKRKSNKPSRGRDVRPELSSEGRVQAEKDLKILRGNIAKLKRNLQTARGNLKVLHSELEELHALKKSHLTLQKRIQQYIRVAESSLKRNESARQELAALEAKLLPALKQESDPELNKKAEDLSEQTKERETWKKDTLQKKARAQKLEMDLAQNLTKVDARIPPIEDQIKEWNDKIRQLEGELDRMQLQERRLSAKAK